MAWLIYGVPIKPRFNPIFEWSGLTEGQRQGLEAGKQIEIPQPPIVGRKLSGSGKLHPLPDLFKGCNAWIVCEAFKQIVEALEPNVSQFLSVRLLDEIEKEIQERYYLMNVTEMNDTLDLQKSYVRSSWQEIKVASGEVKRIQSWHLDPSPELLVAAEGSTSGKHLWRGATHFRRYLFFSDELMTRTKKARLEKLISYRVEEE